MPSRLIPVATSLALLSSCALPRAGMVVGAATAISGVVVFAAGQQHHEEPAAFGSDIAPVFLGVVGAFLVLTGLGIFGSGAAGLEQERLAEEAAEGGPPRALPAAAGTPVARMAPPGSATAVLIARADRLALQLHMEARAGHCRAATELARRLAVLDRARTIALIERDPDVESCVGYQR